MKFKNVYIILIKNVILHNILKAFKRCESQYLHATVQMHVQAQ